jgi:hypothetical protein
MAHHKDREAPPHRGMHCCDQQHQHMVGYSIAGRIIKGSGMRARKEIPFFINSKKQHTAIYEIALVGTGRRVY